MGVYAPNKPSEGDCSNPNQPNFHDDQPATSKGKLKKPVAGWMMRGPIQMGPVSPAGRTVLIIITHNCEELFSSFLPFTGQTNLERKKRVMVFLWARV